jgi:hypothetical protein
MRNLFAHRKPLSALAPSFTGFLQFAPNVKIVLAFLQLEADGAEVQRREDRTQDFQEGRRSPSPVEFLTSPGFFFVLKIVINFPASDCDPNAIHIGPTAVDFSMLPGNPAPASEARQLQRWKAQDLAAYHHETRTRRNQYL